MLPCMSRRFQKLHRLRRRNPHSAPYLAKPLVCGSQVFVTVFICTSLFAADVWETREVIDINGVTSEKSVVISDSVMKVVNTSPNGETETLVDLKADKITIVTHNQKSFQIIKLSEYVKFAQQLFNELKEKSGSVDPEKVIPKVTFEKQGNDTVGKWNCEVWTVSVDGKPYSKVWLAPELKNQQLVDFKNKFSAIIPENLAKYRTVDAQIDDNFISKGTIVKSLKLAQNPKMPVVTVTLKNMTKADVKKLNLAIPSNYTDKSSPAVSKPQSK